MVASSSRSKKPRRSKKFRGHIPTEVLYEIFHRLPTLKSVYRFRCVSKLWNSLLSEPSFMNKIFSNISSTPWIFMYDPSSDEPGHLYLNHDHKFINHHDGLSFEFLLDTSPFTTQKIEKACLLDSCSNGLVLYSPHPLVKYSSAEEADNINTMFYICNPLTKQWVSLARRPYNGSQDYLTEPMKLVCDTSTASLSHSICNYKAVYIYYDFTDKTLDTAKVCFQIFSSDTREWKTFQVPVVPRQTNDFSKMVIRHGVLYWKARTDEQFLIAYRLENLENGSDRCRSIVIPKKSDEYIRKSFLGDSKGSIYYGHITSDYRRRYKVFLSVWQLEDDYTNGGLKLQMVHKNIELKGYRSTYFKIEDIYINPVDQNVIIIVDRGCCLAYNIKTLTHEVLHGCPIPIKLDKLEGYDSPPILITPKPTVIPFIER